MIIIVVALFIVFIAVLSLITWRKKCTEKQPKVKVQILFNNMDDKVDEKDEKKNKQQPLPDLVMNDRDENTRRSMMGSEIEIQSQINMLDNPDANKGDYDDGAKGQAVTIRVR